MTIITTAIIIMVGMHIIAYRRLIYFLDKLKQKLKLGQDGKEFGSDDAKKKDN